MKSVGSSRAAVSDEEREAFQAEYQFAPMQPGDVKETYADISAIQRDCGFAPTTPISEGVPKFIAWFKQHRRV